MLNIDDVIKDYLHYAIRYNNEVGNSKYCIQRMLGSLQATDKGKACLQAQSLDDIWYDLPASVLTVNIS